MATLIEQRLGSGQYTWLITGVAGFIGSNLLCRLLELNQRVVGVDNFSTGQRSNLDRVRKKVGEQCWKLFEFHEHDLIDAEFCLKITKDVDFISHQAALGSVPRSIENPLATHRANVDGFVNLLWAAVQAGVKRFVYASSSSVYGSDEQLPKQENRTGDPLSPYALTKVIDEMYAKIFTATYGIECIGLRYFNVFGPQQNPEGPYAAVVPKWIRGLLLQEPVCIFGDGETSRDFCYVDNAVQANIHAAITEVPGAANRVYNIAINETTSLNDLYRMIRDEVVKIDPKAVNVEPVYKDFREGDIRHSLADVTLAKQYLQYTPEVTVRSGIQPTVEYYTERFLS